MVSMNTANRMSSAMMIFMGGIWVLNIIPPRRRENGRGEGVKQEQMASARIRR